MQALILFIINHGSLLIVRRMLCKNILMNLRTKADSYFPKGRERLPAGNHSLDLQIADVTVSCPTCI
jgi:hypothetical protein